MWLVGTDEDYEPIILSFSDRVSPKEERLSPER